MTLLSAARTIAAAVAILIGIVLLAASLAPYAAPLIWEASK